MTCQKQSDHCYLSATFRCEGERMEKRGRRYEWNEYFKVNDGVAMNRFVRTMENKLDDVMRRMK